MKGVNYSLFERFWSKVDTTGDCWLWRGSRNTKGYGSFRVGNKTLTVHRIAYELLIGPIPDGLTLDHLCRNPVCVNPNHLEPLTGRENTLRGDNPPARNARKTHCPQGHPYDLLNTYIFGHGYRDCRACRKERGRRRRR